MMKDINRLVTAKITDSHAQQNVQRATDLLGVNRQNFAMSYEAKRQLWMYRDQDLPSQHTANVATNLLSYLEFLIVNQHAIIGENLVDLEFDANDEVTVATAREGFVFLKLAVTESALMVREYADILAYHNFHPSNSEGSEAIRSCVELHHYVKEVTRYNDFIHYISSTFDVLWTARIGFEERVLDKYIEDTRKSDSHHAIAFDKFYKNDHKIFYFNVEEAAGDSDDEIVPIKRSDYLDALSRAKGLYRSEVKWDMAHFSYEYEDIRGRLEAFPVTIIDRCEQIRADPLNYASKSNHCTAKQQATICPQVTLTAVDMEWAGTTEEIIVADASGDQRCSITGGLWKGTEKSCSMTFPDGSCSTISPSQQGVQIRVNGPDDLALSKVMVSSGHNGDDIVGSTTVSASLFGSDTETHWNPEILWIVHRQPRSLTIGLDFYRNDNSGKWVYENLVADSIPSQNFCVNDDVNDAMLL